MLTSQYNLGVDRKSNFYCSFNSVCHSTLQNSHIRSHHHAPNCSDVVCSDLSVLMLQRLHSPNPVHSSSYAVAEGFLAVLIEM